VKFAFPQWRGFELPPDGHLLDQVVDLSGAMGFVYERSVGFYKDFHSHDRPMIVLPRGSCMVKVRTASSRTSYELDQSCLLVVPRDEEHEDEGVTSIFDTLALYPSAALLDQVAADEGIPAPQVRQLFSRCQRLSRSRWLEQLLQEYFFARVVSRRASARTLAFFERQILVELIASALRRRRANESDRAAAATEGVTGRALRYIESNLFSRLPLEAIAREAFASASTLLRRFRQDTGTSPHAYIRTRRLEEARRLIDTRTHPVGDVAMLVGYENFGAFSTAFRKHFGAAPSTFARGTSSRKRPSPSRGRGGRSVRGTRRTSSGAS
jgi:AraC-like DNA-binding protein